jgi:hypothetical protein
MDVLFFLRFRTKFIREFYVEASFPFTERKRKIEAGEEPFAPSYSEESEPAFLLEWEQADESLDVLGQMCISVLEATLHLYIEESLNDLRGMYGADVARPDEAEFKRGWINGYRSFFREELNIDWEKGPSDLGLLEEIVLARNRFQHPETISTLTVYQSKHDAAKYPHSFFADEAELRLWAYEQSVDFVPPCRLNVTSDKLFAAVDDVDEFCVWLEEQASILAKHRDRRALVKTPRSQLNSPRQRRPRPTRRFAYRSPA